MESNELMRYREFRPDPALRDYVDAFISIDYHDPGGKPSPVQRCLPLAMAGLLIHVRGNRSYYFGKKGPVLHPEAYFVGIMKEPARWGTPSDSASFGVRFTPDGLLRIFGVPLSGCFNGFVDARDYFDDKLSIVIRQVQDARNDHERVHIMERFLLNMLGSVMNQRNYLADSLKLIRTDNSLDIKALSSEVCVGERQLQRSFKEVIGLSPKYYQRISRFRKALILSEKNFCGWTDIAFRSGYSDQAHLIRDFKEFSGFTPGHFFNTTQAGLASE